MRITTWIYALLTALAIIAAPAASRAMDYRFTRVGPETSAIGEATIRGNAPSRTERILSIDVFRLKPGSTYSVWLTRDGKRDPAGLSGRNSFKTDGSGNAHYTASKDEYEMRLRTLEIAYHPDGDIRNTSGMVVVLKTYLY